MNVVHLASAHSAFDVRVFRRECQALAAAGYEVSLVVPHREEGVFDGVRIVPVPLARTRLSRATFTCMRIFQTAWRLPADVYHLHDLELVPWGLLLARLTRARVVYDVHEYYPSEMASRDWVPGPLRRPFAGGISWLEAFAARRFDGIVAVNDDMAEGFRRFNPRVVTVRNCPRLELFPNSVTAVQPPEEPAEIVYLGDLSDDRGLMIIVDAMRLLADRGVKAHCSLVGWISAGRFRGVPITRLNAQWAPLSVEITGKLPYHEALGRLRSASVAWLPFQPTSLNHERAIPNKLLEYMAAGKPVVASDFGYIAEIVQGSGGGLLVRPSDAKAHADALEYLIDHTDEAREMGARGHQAVLERYNWATEEATLLDFYRQLIG